MTVDMVAAISTARWTNWDVSATTEVPKAQVLWALKAINFHYSYKSSEDVAHLFHAMFSDSQNARTFEKMQLYVHKQTSLAF